MNKCPVCGGRMQIVELRCVECGLSVRGNFPLPDYLGELTEEQWEFIRLFIKNRGNIKEMEKELGVSYPTIKSRLNEVRRALGFADDDADKEEILDDLEAGRISVDEAVKRLKKT